MSQDSIFTKIIAGETNCSHAIRLVPGRNSESEYNTYAVIVGRTQIGENQ